jgi:hypothetical protein
VLPECLQGNSVLIQVMLHYSCNGNADAKQVLVSLAGCLTCNALYGWLLTTQPIKQCLNLMSKVGQGKLRSSRNQLWIKCC